MLYEAMTLPMEIPVEIEARSDMHKEILDLKRDFEYWTLQIQDFLRGCSWQYPLCLENLEKSEMRLDQWQARLAQQTSFDKEPYLKRIAGFRSQRHVEKQPEASELERVQQVLEKLSKLWPPVAIKYVSYFMSYVNK